MAPQTKLVVGLVSGSHFVNHMYLVLLPPIFAVLVLEFDVNLAALGLALGVQGGVNTALQLPFGYLADNYSRTATLALCLVLGALGVFIVAAAPNYAWLVAGLAVLGAGVAGHHPAHYPLLSDASDERHKGRVFSVHGFAGNLGFAAPPAFITAIIALPGLTWRHALFFIGLVGGLYAVVAPLALARFVDDDVTLPAPSGTNDADHLSLRVRVISGLRSLVASPPILALGLLALVTSTASWGLTSYVVVLLTDGYGLQLGLANLTLSAMFVASAAMVLLGGELTDRFSPGPVMVSSYAVVTAAVVVLASLGVPALVAVGVAVVAGGVRSVSGPARSKLADVLSSQGDLGKNFAIITIGIMSGSSVAPPVFGAIIETAGLQAAFLAIATIVATAAVLAGVIVWSYSENFRSPVAGQPGDD